MLSANKTGLYPNIRKYVFTPKQQRLKSKDQRKDAKKSQERRKGRLFSLFGVVFFAGFLYPFAFLP
jgi:hypothetical protein